MLAEQGLFGFIPFIALTIAVWYLLRAFRRRARSRHDIVLAAAAAGATLGYLLMSLTLMMVNLGPSNMFFVILIAMCAGRMRALSVSERGAASAPAATAP
jgi:O-antigen ligase